MNSLNYLEKNFIFRWYVGMIFYYFDKKIVKTDYFDEIKEYYEVWEEWLCLNSMIISLLGNKVIPFKLGRLVIQLLEKFPADWIYVQKETANKLVKKLNNTKMLLIDN